MKQDSNELKEEEVINQVYEFAAGLLYEENRTSDEVENILIERGLNNEDASAVVENLNKQFQLERAKRNKEADKKEADNNMLYGFLWLVGGSIATIADFGYVFWGAIIFGAFQFIKGVSQSNNL